MDLPGVAYGMIFDASNTMYAVAAGAIYTVTTNGLVSLFPTTMTNLLYTSGIAMDNQGNLVVHTYTYTSDSSNSPFNYSHFASVIAPSGVVLTNIFAGSSEYLGGVDGGASGPVVDGSNYIYLSIQTLSRGGGGNIAQISETGATQVISSHFSYQGGFMAYSPVSAPFSDLPDTPNIIGQPQSQTVPIGGTATFSAHALIPPFTYQWYFNQTNAIPGATNGVLTLNNVTLDQVGTYSAVVSNSAGSATSQLAQLNALPALDIHMDPVITLHGGVGLTYDLQYIDMFGPTNQPWTTLVTITLTNSAENYTDLSATGQPVRFYRIVQDQ